ncbi:MAG TPA: immunoglobulin domain-containing protein [Thermoanaerobaculia bacterium]|nr:immunoglobulin domain-containing protein [Thermoanaerobaculia bacterium]
MWIRNAALFAVALIALDAAAQDAAGKRMLRPRSDACIQQAIACGATVTGDLSPGDCTLTSDGTRYDVWSFNGSFGDVVTARLEAIDGTLTNPGLWIETPGGNPTLITMFGDRPAVGYTLTSTGRWFIIVNTLDLSASGRYRLSLQCASGNPPSPFECVTQELGCNQTGLGVINADSCELSDSGRYTSYKITVAAGDIVNIDATSADFAATVALYGEGDDPIASGFANGRGGIASLRYLATAAGLFEVAVYGQGPSDTGTFGIKMECQTTCTQPTISLQPSGGHTLLGSTFTFNTAAVGSPPFTFQWYRGQTGDTSSPIGGDDSKLVVTVNEALTVWVRVRNGCGSRDSVTATVTPDPPKRRRGTR